MKNINIDYYTKNIANYISDTKDVDMGFQYSLFERYLKDGDGILEIGFGGGRDMRYFDKKYKICGIDITPAFVENMKKEGYNVSCQSAVDFYFDKKFDGIWACASLLHIEKKYLHKTFLNCYNHLKKGGIFYFSFKYGDFEGERKERFFCDMNENTLKEILNGIDFKILEKVITKDNRANREDIWFNVVLKKF